MAKDNEKQQDQKANKGQEDHPGYVEGKDNDGNVVRSVATPPDSPLQGHNQGNPEGEDYVGLLEVQVNPDPAQEVERQQEENFPRLAEDYFDPKEMEPEEPRQGRSATSRADIGRVVVVDHDVIHDGEVVKAGVQDLPLSVADALISEGAAWEPAGKKRGR